MSYGHGNTKRLRFVVDNLARYVEGRIRHSRKPLKRVTARVAPPALRLAYLRGDALLTLRFTDWCEAQDIGIDDPDHVWALHERIIADRGGILDLVNRTGLPSAVATQTILPPTDGELAYRLYCGLLDDLERAEEFRLLEIATDFFFAHRFRGLFPDRPQKTNTRTIEGLKARCHARLRKHFHRPFDLRESFRQEADAVEFHLRLKLGDTWHALPVETGKRLKPTRLSAYESLLSALAEKRLDDWLAASTPMPEGQPQASASTTAQAN